MRAAVGFALLLSLTAAPARAQAPAATSPAPDAAGRGTAIAGALGDSMTLLLIEHSTRIAFQQKTRDALRGPFWSDYRDSLRVPRRWEDGDAWWVNYLGHPVHGAAAGLIWLDHGRDEPLRLSMDSRYWTSRARSAAFIAVYSLQFEFGPLSEASIGNVGMRPETTGWVDHVVTPVGGLALLVAEDAIDRYLVEFVERHTGNRTARAAVRMLFNPARTFANLAESRAPWHRADRPLGRR
ncbi:MAG: hypothetical protein IT176_02890 [Acidobacteria bacterium]|nr:hypothetical protein [Acidobacteriota bacterium]